MSGLPGPGLFNGSSAFSGGGSGTGGSYVPPAFFALNVRIGPHYVAPASPTPGWNLNIT